MPIRRPLAAVTAAFLLALVPLAGVNAATEATSSADAERLLVDLVNQRRAQAGVPALTPRSDLHAVARDWSFTQAERDQLAHNSNLGSQVCCWTRVAENVATAGGLGDASASRLAETLYGLWRDSGPHDAAMVDPDVDQVGFGVVVDDDGSVWGTTVFRACDGSGCAGGAQGPGGDRTSSWAPAPPPEPEPAPEPAPEPDPEPEPEPTTAARAAPGPAPDDRLQRDTTTAASTAADEPAATPAEPSPSPVVTPSPDGRPLPAPAAVPSAIPTEVPRTTAPTTAPSAADELPLVPRPNSLEVSPDSVLVPLGAVLAVGAAAAGTRRRRGDDD